METTRERKKKEKKEIEQSSVLNCRQNYIAGMYIVNLYTLFINILFRVLIEYIILSTGHFITAN